MPENAIAVALVLPDLTRSVAEEHLSELEKLIETAGGTVVDRVFAKRPRPDPANVRGILETYIGGPPDAAHMPAYRCVQGSGKNRVALAPSMTAALSR